MTHDPAITQDALFENNETIVVDISGFSGVGSIEGSPNQQVITIINDDAAPNATLLLQSPATISESGGITYVVAELDAASGLTTTVPLQFSGTATGGGTDYSVSSSSIVIVAGDRQDSIAVFEHSLSQVGLSLLTSRTTEVLFPRSCFKIW